MGNSWLMVRSHRELILDCSIYQRKSTGMFEQPLFIRAKCRGRKSTEKGAGAETGQDIGQYPSDLRLRGGGNEKTVIVGTVVQYLNPKINIYALFDDAIHRFGTLRVRQGHYIMPGFTLRLPGHHSRRQCFTVQVPLHRSNHFIAITNLYQKSKSRSFKNPGG